MVSTFKILHFVQLPFSCDVVNVDAVGSSYIALCQTLVLGDGGLNEITHFFKLEK